MRHIHKYQTTQDFLADYYGNYSKPWLSLIKRPRRVDYNKKYIKFADPEVERICVENWGDGSGITEYQAGLVTSAQFENKFEGNTTITSFNELVYFTGLTKLDTGEFNGCTNLVNAVLPSTITHVGNDLFRGCSELEGPITVPAYTGNVGGSAFRDCTSLTEVSFLPDGTLWESVCEGCTSLTKATIGCAILGNRVFYGCTSLDSLTILRSTSYGARYSNQFYGCTNLERVDIPSTDVWTACVWGGINSYPFGASSEGHLYINNVEVTSIVIPNGTTSISAFAFLRLRNVTSLTIPSTVTSIGTTAFNGMSSLVSLDIPSSVTSIGEYLCAHDVALTSVSIGGRIGRETFDDCPLLATLTLTSPLVVNGTYAFRGCTSLKRVNVDSIETWVSCSYGTSSTMHPSYASLECHIYINNAEVTTASIPSTITAINNYAFYRCVGITSISIPSTVTSIGISAFANCTALGTLTIPSTVTSVGNYAFNNLTGLADLIINCQLPNLDTIQNAGNGTGTLKLTGDYSSFPGAGGSLIATRFKFKHIILNGNITSSNANCAFIGNTTYVESVRISGNVAFSGGFRMFSNPAPEVKFMEINGQITNGIYYANNYPSNNHIFHLGYNGVACPPSYISMSANKITTVYVGDGSSQAADQAVLNQYLADTDWAAYSSKLDLWYNYNGEYKTTPAIPT